jgi:hypothetical protein
LFEVSARFGRTRTLWPFRKVARRPRGAECIAPTTDSPHLRHRVTPDGFYRGRRVIEKPAEADEQE